jgi:hypothetical protein
MAFKANPEPEQVLHIRKLCLGEELSKRHPLELFRKQPFSALSTETVFG